jgi:hypothetical protein
MPKQTTLGAHNGKDHAWAIELKPRKDDEEKLRLVRSVTAEVPTPNFAGIYSFTHFPQFCQRGCTTALFETRADARAARKGLYGFGPRRAVIRKVAVRIEVLPERP